MASMYSIEGFFIVLLKGEINHVLLYVMYMDHVQYCKNKTFVSKNGVYSGIPS